MTSVNIINVIIGSGIIALPVSFSHGGVGTSVILLMVASLVSHFTIVAISMVMEMTGKITFQECVQETLGLPGLVCITICQILYPYFAVLSYGIVICDNFTSVFSFLANGIPILQNRLLILCIPMFLIIFPLSSFKNVSFLDKASLVSVICVVFYFGVLLFKTAFQPQLVFNFPNIYKFAESGVALSISVLAFAMGCQPIIPPIYRAMKNKSVARISYSSYGSLGFTTIIYNIIAVSGYIMFGGMVQGNLLQSFCSDDKLITATRIVFAITIILTSPLQIISSREGITTLIYKKIKFRWWVHILITFILCVIAYAISGNVTDLGIVISLAGSLVGSPIGFIIPSISLLVGMKKGYKPDSLLKIMCYFVAFFGTAVMIIGAIMTFLGQSSSIGTKYWCSFDIIKVAYNEDTNTFFKNELQKLWIKN